MGFEFQHKKRTVIKNEQGGTFEFEHIKRLPHEAKRATIYSGGAFSNAFDPISFWVGNLIGGALVTINDFIFKRIKTSK